MSTSSKPTEFDGKAFARGLSTAPGVYRMIGADDNALYVGKASALKNRVSSYFNATPKSARTRSMRSFGKVVERPIRSGCCALR